VPKDPQTVCGTFRLFRPRSFIWIGEQGGAQEMTKRQGRRMEKGEERRVNRRGGKEKCTP